MSAAHILRAPFGCSTCRSSVIRHFVSLGIASTRSKSRTDSLVNDDKQRRYLRPFTTATRRFVTHSSAETTASKEHVNEAPSTAISEGITQRVDDESLAADPAVASQDQAIPWYLQVDRPQKPPSGPSYRQRLPELPRNSPEKLPAIMEHLFTDIGLDDLRILDLRNMDPPQALGANLMMVFGTARGEKHLHTSADRFCRWLRSTYKLRPYADGLLGRNELKIKLRRKAKRAKLLGGKQNQDQEVDDGIRTDWVCVNVGAIEAGKNATAEDLQGKGIVGFGTGVSGVHLVVQMMTEAKREDLDLEKLWADALGRHERRQVRLGISEQSDAVEDAVA